MPVLAMVELKGDVAAILAAKKELMDPVADRVFPTAGHRLQVIAHDADGVRIFNLWDDADGRDRANTDPAMEAARRAIVERTGAEPAFASWDVVDWKLTG